MKSSTLTCCSLDDQQNKIIEDVDIRPCETATQLVSPSLSLQTPQPLVLSPGRALPAATSLIGEVKVNRFKVLHLHRPCASHDITMALTAASMLCSSSKLAQHRSFVPCTFQHRATATIRPASSSRRAAVVRASSDNPARQVCGGWRFSAWSLLHACKCSATGACVMPARSKEHVYYVCLLLSCSCSCLGLGLLAHTRMPAACRTRQ